MTVLPALALPLSCTSLALVPMLLLPLAAHDEEGERHVGAKAPRVGKVQAAGRWQQREETACGFVRHRGRNIAGLGMQTTWRMHVVRLGVSPTPA